MRADDLRERFAFDNHVENGQFLETHYLHTGKDRALSGSMYYYVGSKVKTSFHRIDCDEYWSYNAGSDLEIWMINTNGDITVSVIGTGKGANPTVFVPKGTIFASKHGTEVNDGTFVSCITVPRFDYEGLEVLDFEDLKKKYPLLERF